MRFVCAVTSLLAFAKHVSNVESFSTHSGISKIGRLRSELRVQDFAVTETEGITSSETVQRRVLGSQENLMLPRQYSPNPDVTFPSMSHVSCAVLSSTPTEAALAKAIDEVMMAHPLLRCKIEGDGQPDERIDLLQMVRKGEPNPCTFVSKPGMFSASDVLRTVNVEANDRSSLDKSWQSAFNRDLDDGSWCNVETSPLWKVEFHRSKEGSDSPCALLFSFNHAISDQSSANKLTDQIVSLLAEIDENGSVLSHPVAQEIPPSVEESVLGKRETWKDIGSAGISPGTIKYVAGKALEETKAPVILPDGFGEGGGVLGAIATITGNAAGGEDSKSMERKSVLEFRTLSKQATSSLLEKCRENGVSITNALSAALTLTSTDFIDGGKPKSKERNYKILQSLDMRRFGKAEDTGKSVGCLAGSMDLMHGPLPDRSGERVGIHNVAAWNQHCRSHPFSFRRQLRTQPTKKGLKLFWDLAREGQSQTESFVASDGPTHAVRVFDFAMTVSDLNNLVHLTAQSKDSQGRAYSAGFANAGVYERLEAFQKEGGEQRTLKVGSPFCWQEYAMNDFP
eukprot:scaffold6638_cov127-Cylindrotheca_fusiformis.AAC.23